MMLADKPQAPRLETGGANLPLTKITAAGKITPTTAILTIAQEFVNGPKLADVTYHCPLHPDWAVKAVTMRCGERTIHTVVMPNQQAKDTFDQAKQAGHTAILADEVASDELRLQLANVPAGDTVQVTTEIVAWPIVEADRGSILIPLINGPKYGGTEAQQPYFDADDIDAKHTGCHLDLELAVDGASIDFGTIVDGKVQGEIEPVGQVTVSFAAAPNAMWCEDESGKYLVVGVPAVRPENPSSRWEKTTILIDRSGSMGGQGMATATQISRDIVGRIGDRLRYVYTFDTDCEPIWAADVAVRRRGRNDLSAIDAISHLTPRGGTELLKAIERIHSEVKGSISDLVIVTDALVYQNEYQELAQAARKMTQDGIAVHVVLVGPAPGRFIGECITQAGGGFCIEASGSRYDSDALQDCVTRFLSGGATLESITIDGVTTPCKHPVRGRPVMVAAEANSRPTSVRVQIEGVPAFDVPVADTPDARFIWAKEKVMSIVRGGWVDGTMIDDHKDEIEKIGVAHQILTPFTSMVGFDASQVNDRSDVQQAIAQASLPTGMDAGSFWGVNGGGALGIQRNVVIAQALDTPQGAITLASASMNMNDVDMVGPVSYLASADSGRLTLGGGGMRMRRRGGQAKSFSGGSRGADATTFEGFTKSLAGGTRGASAGGTTLGGEFSSDARGDTFDASQSFYSPAHTAGEWMPQESGDQGWNTGAQGPIGNTGPVGSIGVKGPTGPVLPIGPCAPVFQPWSPDSCGIHSPAVWAGE